MSKDRWEKKRRRRIKKARKRRRRELYTFMYFILGQISVDGFRDIVLKKFIGYPNTMRNGSKSCKG